MRTAAIFLLALGLSACGGSEAEAPAAAAQRGIDRSVADIRAAEAAAQQPVVVSKSVGELTGKASAEAAGAKAAAKGTSGKERTAAPAGDARPAAPAGAANEAVPADGTGAPAPADG
jgi:hypothetical protein